MDSIVSAALTEICSQGINGILLEDLLLTLQKPLSSSGLSLCDSVKTTIYNRLVKIPGLEFKDSSTTSSCKRTCSFEEAEKLGLRIVAADYLRDSFVGIYDLKAADAGISAPQRRALDILARARSAGVTQSDLAKEFDMKGNNFFYVVRNLECQGLVVRQSTMVTTARTEESTMEGESVSNNTPIVHTNLIHLYRYAKRLNSQQKFKIIKGDVLESPKCAEGSTLNGEAAVGDNVKADVLVMDYLPGLKAVCDKLEEAEGKELVVSDIKQALGYKEAAGHRAWRKIRNQLKDAGLVEEFDAKVNGKTVSCMRLLKKNSHKQFEPKHAACGTDVFNSGQQVKFGNRGQVSAQIFELPIEHQIHDMIAAEGTKGITVNEILKGLGLGNKKYYTRLLNMFSRFGCHLQSESHNRSKLYRVWTSGNFNDSSLSTLPLKQTDVVNVVEPSSRSKKDLDLKSEEDMLQLESLTTNEESAPEKVESEHKGREPFCSPGATSENNQMVISGSHPHDLASSSGNAELDLVQNESNIVSSETPPSSNHSRIQSYQKYSCLTRTPASSQREQRLLERIQEGKVVLLVELYKWLKNLEKDKLTAPAKKTVTHALNKLQAEGHCKCIHVSVPVGNNFGRNRTTEVVLHKSVEVRGQVHERLRSFDMLSRGQGTSRKRHLESQAPLKTTSIFFYQDFQELPRDQTTTTSGEEMQTYGGKRRKRTKCHLLPGKFLKQINEGTSVSRRAYESLAVANAVELLKLVFLSISTAPEVLTLLAQTLRRYSEHDLFAAYNYLRQKKFMVGGNGKPFLLSQHFMHSVSSSPFPINTGERASKFASWLCEKENSLIEEGIHLNADLQCGEIFHLLALVSSRELCISPCLPEEGVGDVEEKRNCKRKTYEDEICNSDQVKKPVEGECSTRREKGFPGINVSLIHAIIPRIDCGEVSNKENIRTCSSQVEKNDRTVCSAMGIGGDVSAKLNSRSVGSSAASSVSDNEYPCKAMADYSEYLMSNLSDEDRVGPIYPEIFENLHSAILKSGDQGLSMLEISKVAAIRGEKMAELIVDVLQVFGLAMRVNGYDDVHVVDTSFRSKYFLSSADGRCQNIKFSPNRKRRRVSNDNYLRTSQENWEKDVTNVESDVVHKVTMLNLPEDVSQLSVERQPHEVNVTFQDTAQVELVSSERQKESSECTMCLSDSHSFRPILPWINGDGTTNHIVYKGLTRCVLGIVMQNPGIRENDLIQQMNTLNPQNCRKLLGLMVLDNHLIVKKMYQSSSAGPPGTLLSLLCESFKKSESIYREHFFANPMSTSSL
ncbi:hypothetical protein MKW94_017459 [Papaver nudicaule]|uniref:B-block binding subunit of TFIIIC domain-containing protein n=1 Tax=Papaver nudicaule TaxID=74823 RepID=A0AA42AV85_PAPNU|nr:hypothetical protein [Papaver nudicaule]